MQTIQLSINYDTLFKLAQNFWDKMVYHQISDLENENKVNDCVYFLAQYANAGSE